MFENWTWIAIGIGFLLFGAVLFIIRQMSVRDHLSESQTTVSPRMDPGKPQLPGIPDADSALLKKLLSLAGSGMVVLAVILYLAASFNIIPGDSVAVIAFVLFFVGTLLRSFTRTPKNRQRKQ